MNVLGLISQFIGIETLRLTDMLVKTKDEDKHLDDLEETFKTLRQYRMKLNPSFWRLFRKVPRVHGVPKMNRGKPG